MERMIFLFGEGGAGKTFISSLLKDYLKSKGYKIATTALA